MTNESSNEKPSCKRPSDSSQGDMHHAALSVAAQTCAINAICAQRGWPTPVYYEDSDEERGEKFAWNE